MRSNQAAVSVLLESIQRSGDLVRIVVLNHHCTDQPAITCGIDTRLVESEKAIRRNYVNWQSLVSGSGIGGREGQGGERDIGGPVLERNEKLFCVRLIQLITGTRYSHQTRPAGGPKQLAFYQTTDSHAFRLMARRCIFFFRQCRQSTSVASGHPIP